MIDDLPFVQLQSAFGQAIKYAGLRMKEKCEAEMEEFDIILGYLRAERRALLEIEEAARKLPAAQECVDKSLVDPERDWPQFRRPIANLDELREPAAQRGPVTAGP